MTPRLKKYWDDKAKFYKRDRTQGNFEPTDPGYDWDDKVEYRSREIDPSATKEQYLRHINSKMNGAVKSALPRKKSATSRKKAPQKKSTLQTVAFSAGRGARHILHKFLGRKV
jgi:hypothetical protein